VYQLFYGAEYDTGDHSTLTIAFLSVVG